MTSVTLKISTIERLETILFPLLEILAGSSCGDGDATLVRENYKELAENYNEWRKKSHIMYPKPLFMLATQAEFENQISFYQPQESIAFAKEVKREYTYETLVEIIGDVNVTE